MPFFTDAYRDFVLGREPASLLACAWGRPSEAFGPFYSAFDGTRNWVSLKWLRRIATSAEER